MAALFTFLDGALTDELRLVIQMHLDRCAPCFSAYEFHIELRTVVQQRCQTVLPAGLKERIFLEVARQQVRADSD
ncbi:MAG: zf-HC2 domain-containing protein [Actinomycetota bacterium]|nr:zf-HC2 domain-containing protein [Actinomycetota bacterium]